MCDNPELWYTLCCLCCDCGLRFGKVYSKNHPSEAETQPPPVISDQPSPPPDNSSTTVDSPGSKQTDPLTKSSDEDSSDEDNDDGFGGSTVDIIILVIGSAVIILFMVGMCYTCYKMRNRQRQRTRDNARTRFRSAVAVIQVSRSPPVMEQCPDPSAPPVEHVRGVLPPYSPPPVFPDEPPPQYTEVAESPKWPPRNPQRNRTPRRR